MVRNFLAEDGPNMSTSSGVGGRRLFKTTSNKGEVRISLPIILYMQYSDLCSFVGAKDGVGTIAAWFAMDFTGRRVLGFRGRIRFLRNDMSDGRLIGMVPWMMTRTLNCFKRTLPCGRRLCYVDGCWVRHLGQLPFETRVRTLKR